MVRRFSICHRPSRQAIDLALRSRPQVGLGNVKMIPFRYGRGALPENVAYQEGCRPNLPG
jgi:hypothetical protein